MRIKTILNGISALTSPVYCVSYEKSGRTWLRLLLAKIINLEFKESMRLDNHIMSMGTPFPNVYFTHLGTNKGQYSIISSLLNKKRIILLIRDPRDLIVSLYYERKYRQGIFDGDISEFIRENIMDIIDFMNDMYWVTEKTNSIIVRYEDMIKNTRKELKRILDFLGAWWVDDFSVDEAVNYCSFKNMKKLEATNRFNDKRLRPADPCNENTYKVRKGKVGNYKKELNKRDIEFLNDHLKVWLDDELKY